jgi:uncharacterized protein YqeY
MSIKQQLTNDLKEAMKSKNKLRLSAIRAINTSIKNKEIELGKDVVLDAIKEDEMVLGVIQKVAKTLKDSYDAFVAAGYEEKAAEDKAQLDFVNGYLPTQMTEDEIRTLVSSLIMEGKNNLKTLMPALMPQVKGKADGKLVNQIAKELLG